MDRPHVVALCGSRREGSYTRLALTEALAGVEEAGSTAELLDLTALNHLRAVCRALNAWVLPYQAAVPHAHTAFDADGFIANGLCERVRTLGEHIVTHADVEPETSRVMQPRMEV